MLAVLSRIRLKELRITFTQYLLYFINMKYIEEYIII